HADNNRRMDNNPRDNDAPQPPYKRQNVARAYTDGPGEKRERSWPLDPRLLESAATNNQRTLTCFECGNKWHYCSECSKLKNQNFGNQTRNGKAHGRAYALGG
ncbi:reverse transcriptase domain-containing protein, partial [Tanacetum coccineum]